MDPNAPGYPMHHQHLQHPQHPQQHQQHPFPVTSQSPQGQQFSYYPNPVPSYPQQKQPQHQHQPSFGAVPLQPGPGGAMMPSGYPQPSPGPHANFSAPFAQPPVPTTMGQFLPPQTPSSSSSNIPTTAAAQSFQQNMASMAANNMVPAQQPQPQQQHQQHQQPQPQHQQKPIPQQNPSQAPSQANAQAPAVSAREKARVATLLDINSMLLEEVVNLQASGKAGGPPPQQGSQDNNNPSPASDQGPDSAKGPAQKPSPEYFECMRRLQANLAYLATVADRAKKSGGVPPPNPGIMTPPPHLSSMNEIYHKLSELFPRTAQGTPQQSPQLQGNGKPSPSPAAESVA